MSRAVRLLSTLALSALSALPVSAQVLKFDEIPGATTGGVAVGNFYNGGGGAAFNFGIEFIGNASAFCFDRVGTNCSNTSWGGDAAAIARGTEKAGLSIFDTQVIMNRAAGFTSGFSFFYANPFNDAGLFQVYSGLNATGTLLASASMPATPNGIANAACFFDNYCPFVANSVAFAGTALSVRFTTTLPDHIIYDDLTFGSVIPGGGTVVPEPSTVALLAGGLAVVGALARRRASARLNTTSC
jgi:hypothetical protein